MSAALKDPSDAAQRLIAVADLAVREKSYQDRKTALFAYVRGEADLLWEIFQQYWDARAAEILRAAVARKQPPTEKVSAAGRTLSEAAGDRRPRPSGATLTRAAANDAQMRANSWLFKFQVNGKSLGDVSVREAFAFWQSRGRDHRYLELVLSGLPENSSRLVRQFREPDECDKFYQQANEEKLAA